MAAKLIQYMNNYMENKKRILAKRDQYHICFQFIGGCVVTCLKIEHKWHSLDVTLHPSAGHNQFMVQDWLKAQIKHVCGIGTDVTNYSGVKQLSVFWKILEGANLKLLTKLQG